MNFQPRNDEDPEISLTSLIDVVFLLLIFFMITTTFQQQARLRVELPEASLQPSRQPEKELELIIDEEGRYFLAGQEVVNTQASTLIDALTKAARGDVDQPIKIRADARTPHQAVVTAMDAIGQVGFENLAIATTKKRDE